MKSEYQDYVNYFRIEKNAYIAISGRMDPQFEIDSQGAISTVSILVTNDKKTHGVEWETHYGPITALTKTTDNKKEDDHWFFGPITGYGSWTQLAAYSHGLPYRFTMGDYHSIIDILKTYLEEERYGI